jgi:hypothetical protein
MFVAAGRTAAGVGSWQQPPFGRVLTSLIGPAVARSLVDAHADADARAARPPAGAHVDVRWTAIGPGERPSLEGEVGPGGGWAHLRLFPEWVPQVWAQGLANVAGHLVLGVAGHDPAGGRLLLRAVRWRFTASGTPGADPTSPTTAPRWRPGPTTTIGWPTRERQPAAERAGAGRSNSTVPIPQIQA